MAVQLSVAVRNARVNAVEATVGVTPKLQLRTGSQPANCAAAASGTLLAELTLPSDWQGAASGGASALLGTWSGTSVAAGNAGHYRLVDSAGTTCHAQGSVTATGGGGDMTLADVAVPNGATVSVTSFGLTDGNA